MTPTKQIIALAEWDGWTGIEQNHPSDSDEYCGVKPNHSKYSKPAKYPLPSYLTSLDAIMPLVRKLADNSTLFMYFNSELFKTSAKIDLFRGVKDPNSIFKAITATPPQISEALLRTIDKWEED